MSEATFKQHLGELQAVLGDLKGDIETGNVNKINDWYDQVLDVILNFEDTTEDVMESSEPITEQTDDSEEDETENEELEYEDLEDEEDEEEDEEDDVEDDVEDIEDKKEINLVATSGNVKTITINIGLKQ